MGYKETAQAFQYTHAVSNHIYCCIQYRICYIQYTFEVRGMFENYKNDMLLTYITFTVSLFVSKL